MALGTAPFRRIEKVTAPPLPMCSSVRSWTEAAEAVAHAAGARRADRVQPVARRNDGGRRLQRLGRSPGEIPHRARCNGEGAGPAHRSVARAGDPASRSLRQVTKQSLIAGTAVVGGPSSTPAGRRRERPRRRASSSPDGACRRRPPSCSPSTRPSGACRCPRLSACFGCSRRGSPPFGLPENDPAPPYMRPANDSELSCGRRPQPRAPSSPSGLPDGGAR